MEGSCLKWRKRELEGGVCNLKAMVTWVPHLETVVGDAHCISMLF